MATERESDRKRDWAFTLYAGAIEESSGFEPRAWTPSELLGYARTQLEPRRRTPLQNDSEHDILRAAFQAEICPRTNRLHIQGYIGFAYPKRKRTLRRAFPGWHWEQCRKGPRANLEYCTDPRKRVEGTEAVTWGEFPQATQGRRTDIHEFVDTLVSEGLESAVEQRPEILIRYPAGVRRFHQHILRKRFANLHSYRGVTVWIHQGDAGTGKTRAVYERAHVQFQELPYALFSYSPEWWDGYMGEQVILLDDFYGQIPLNRLLRILDRYKILLPVKGSYGFSLWSEVHITTNQPWEDWYQIIRERSQSQENTGYVLFNALKRRINKVIHYRE